MAAAAAQERLVPAVQQIVDSGIDEVPLPFVRPLHDRPLLSHIIPANRAPIPVIDLAPLQHLHPQSSPPSAAHQLLLRSIAHACHEWGFFQVTNHGVPQDVMDGMRAACHAFFGLPAEQRNEYRSQDFEAPVSYATSFNPSIEKARDWKDALYVRDLAGKVPDGFPNAPPICRQAFQEYRKGVQRLANQLYQAIFQSLGLDPDYLKEALPAIPRLIMAVNYYPRCPDPSLTFGITGHSDISPLTVLLQDEVPGLQIRKDDKWIEVQPLPNSFVINLGDVIELMSNGKYKSIEHRAMTNSMKPRLSVACFFGPSEDTVIAPLKELINDKEPALYKDVVFGDYVKNFYSKELLPNRGTLDYAKATL